MLAGENADAESEAVVLTAELVHPVFGDGNLALADLDADVGVLAEALALRGYEETRSETASRISGMTSMLTFWGTRILQASVQSRS